MVCWRLLLAVLAFAAAGSPVAAEAPTADRSPLSRPDSAVVRVMSWNVGKNSIFPPEGVRQASFFRIVRALEPDVIGLQEVVRRGDELVVLLNRHAPLGEGRTWSVHVVSDNALASRHPLRHRGGEGVVPYPLPQYGLPEFHFGFAAAYVELPETRAATGLYLLTMHNKSGASDENTRLRQVQADFTVAWLRDRRGSGIRPSTPLVLMGDLNVVPGASMQPFATLTGGDISDEDQFGPDQAPDWDDSRLADAMPGLNGSREYVYTWRNDEMEFPPSSLDRILYSDSVMSLVRTFVLDTTTLADRDLERLGLERSDVLYDGQAGVYDHLPLIADFVLHGKVTEQR